MATVTDSVATAPFPTGLVNFFADGAATSFASCSLSGSGVTQSCSVSYTPTTVGAHSIVAKYAGDSAHADSTSPPAAVAATKHPTITTVNCSPATFNAGASTSCTATVNDSIATAPFATGTVNFFADASTTAFASCSLSGTGQVQSCAVSYTTSTVGPHTIVATYAGDATHESSTSATAAAVTVLAVADLVITKSAPATATSGTNITYHLVVTNNGPSTSSGGTVTDVLPAGVSFKSASAGCAFTAPSTVGCSFGTLATGSSVSFDIVVHISVLTTGPLINTANVNGNDTDTNPANNTATATTVVSPQTTTGKVTGGGVIDVPGGRANFGFVAQRKTTGGPASGNLNYLDHATKRHVQGPVTSLTITGNSAEFSGPCGSSCTFTVAVQDNAEPDGSGKDTFYITVTPSPPYVAGGTIRSGNIQVRGGDPAGSGTSTVTGAGTGVFPAGSSFNGVNLNGLQFGKGVGVPGDSSTTGDFQALLLGTSLLGQPQNINVVGRASSGLVNPDGTATFSGLSTVDMGNGTPPLTGVPFSVTATTQGLQLILGNTPLPMATLTAGSITIQ
jgi:uncharacterized repeat protein (TIGR01451 family)